MYLRLYDYQRLINADNLQQVISANDNFRLLAEQAAQEEAYSYLNTKFDLSRELTDTPLWALNGQYTGGSRVELNYPIYDSGLTYTHNTLITHNSLCYICTASSTTGAFNLSDWAMIGAQYDLFYVPYPHAYFDAYGIYKVGDQVFYKGKNYTCQIATILPTQQDQLNNIYYNSQATPNVFPDDATYGVKYWGVGTSYIIQGNYPNSGIWVKGDNRSQQLVEVLVNITLYHLHSRIAPRNIPELRITNYKGVNEQCIVVGDVLRYPAYSALGWLQNCIYGDIDPRLPLKQPTNGTRIMWGSTTKAINTY
jgi:hypothetical protein